METKIHATAVVEAGARIGAGCEIMAGAVITRFCDLGEGVTVYPCAVLGGDPQDLHFDRAVESRVRIGSGTVVREHVTVHRSTRAEGATVVGERCFLMAGCHVAHDCAVADDVVVANAVQLAGHVQVGPYCFLGGGAVFHQFCRVGRGAMVSGGSRIALDVPPFLMAAERNEVIGLNVVGLRRRGVAREAIRELKEAFRAVYFRAGNIRELAAERAASAVTAEAREFLTFFAGGKRGFARARRDGEADDE